MLKKTILILGIPPLVILGAGLTYRILDSQSTDGSRIVISENKNIVNEKNPDRSRNPEKDVGGLDIPIPSAPPIEVSKDDQKQKKEYGNGHLQSGYSKLKRGEYNEAIHDFEDAIKDEGNNPNSYIGLGLAYYKIKDMESARWALEEALKLHQGASITHRLLGEIYYQRDDLDNALLHWEKALSIDPADQTSRRMFLKASREIEIHKGFNSESTRHFVVQYEGGENNEIGRKIIDILEDAYSRIGRDLSVYPSKDLSVILYSNQQFSYVTNGPSWSSGIYDGKIRLPIGGLKGDEPVLRQVIFHEYAHSLVHSITERCPTWLNEGLAQYFEGKSQDMTRKVMKELSRRKAIIPLGSLEGSFLGLNKNQANIFYLESLSAVSYMIDRYGLYRVKELLLELSKGNSIDASFKSALYLSYKEFETDWKRTVEG